MPKTNFKYKKTTLRQAKTIETDFYLEQEKYILYVNSIIEIKIDRFSIE